jgi:adenosylcobinamide amidohydrolase
MKQTDIGWTLERNEDFVHVRLQPARPVLSSALVGGGLTRAGDIVNLRVSKHAPGHRRLAPPEETLAGYCRRKGWRGPLVGMMTAASMDSFRRADIREGGVAVTVLATAGISNAGRAGDPAVCRRFDTAGTGAGTVNLIVLTTAALTDAALVESVITITEGKAAAFENLGIRSVASGLQATGTGTDSVAVVAGCGPPRIRFCGKHVLLGEMLAQATIRAISDSLAGYGERR